MRRFAALLLFLVLVDEEPCLYGDYTFAPFHWVYTVLLQPLAGIRPFDWAMIALLVFGAARTRGKAASVTAVRRMLYVAAAVTVGAFLYGVATGGDVHAAGWQAYLPLSLIVTTFAIASIHRTPEHFIGLFDVILAVACWHALMVILFYVFYIRPGSITPRPEYVSTHEDTVIWTATICYVLVKALQKPTRRNRAIAAFVISLLLVAIQLNKRRIAWISLGGALVTLYFLLPPLAAKRRVNRIVTVAAPIFALYVAIGWGHTEGIFRPLMAFQSVSTAEDPSTKARIVENLGLVVTARQGPILGTGWGHKYVEVSTKYQIHGFELWPYVPHNSVLGLLAYTGLVGFFGFWLLFPTAAFFHARLARAQEQTHRLVGLVGMAQIVACADQWYGDMGSFSPVTMYTLAVSLAAALRIPPIAGVLPGRPAASAASLPQKARAA